MHFYVHEQFPQNAHMYLLSNKQDLQVPYKFIFQELRLEPGILDLCKVQNALFQFGPIYHIPETLYWASHSLVRNEKVGCSCGFSDQQMVEFPERRRLGLQVTSAHSGTCMGEAQETYSRRVVLGISISRLKSGLMSRKTKETEGLHR